jgi:hypothetical protein
MEFVSSWGVVDGASAAAPPSAILLFLVAAAALELCAVTAAEALAALLLKAGQPLQPSAPPVPSHLPPPGQVPFGIRSAETVDERALSPEATEGSFPHLLASPGLLVALVVPGRRRRLVGRDEFLALK